MRWVDLVINWVDTINWILVKLHFGEEGDVVFLESCSLEKLYLGEVALWGSCTLERLCDPRNPGSRYATRKFGTGSGDPGDPGASIYHRGPVNWVAPFNWAEPINWADPINWVHPMHLVYLVSMIYQINWVDTINWILRKLHFGEEGDVVFLESCSLEKLYLGEVAFWRSCTLSRKKAVPECRAESRHPCVAQEAGP